MNFGQLKSGSAYRNCRRGTRMGHQCKPWHAQRPSHLASYFQTQLVLVPRFLRYISSLRGRHCNCQYVTDYRYHLASNLKGAILKIQRVPLQLASFLCMLALFLVGSLLLLTDQYLLSGVFISLALLAMLVWWSDLASDTLNK